MLYWMSSARRLRDNFALQLAIELHGSGLPLLLAESLGAEAPHHSQRSHRWLLQGMADWLLIRCRRGCTTTPM